MTYGKKITLFLMDGSAEGRISCELSNWNGKAYRLPRAYVRQCADRNDMDNAGVYILFGKSDNTDKEGLAYIGEADGILKRLTQHLSQKDFWNDVIVFISKDNNLNKAHIKYIEHRLYEDADKVGRYKLENSNTPTRSTISEPDEAEMEEFIANIKLLIGTLGFKIFDPLLSESNTKKTPECFFTRSPRSKCPRNQHHGRIRRHERLINGRFRNTLLYRKLPAFTRKTARRQNSSGRRRRRIPVYQGYIIFQSLYGRKHHYGPLCKWPAGMENRRRPHS